MVKKRKPIIGVFCVAFLAALLLFNPMIFAGGKHKHKGCCKMKGLTDVYIQNIRALTMAGWRTSPIGVSPMAILTPRSRPRLTKLTST